MSKKKNYPVLATDDTVPLYLIFPHLLAILGGFRLMLLRNISINIFKSYRWLMVEFPVNFIIPILIALLSRGNSAGFEIKMFC